MNRKSKAQKAICALVEKLNFIFFSGVIMEIKLMFKREKHYLLHVVG